MADAVTPSPKATSAQRASLLQSLHAEWLNLRNHPKWVLGLAAISCAGTGWTLHVFASGLKPVEPKLGYVAHAQVERDYLSRDTVMHEYVSRSILDLYVPKGQFEQLEAKNRELLENARSLDASYVPRKEYDHLAATNHDLEHKAALADGFEEEIREDGRRG